MLYVYLVTSDGSIRSIGALHTILYIFYYNALFIIYIIVYLILIPYTCIYVPGSSSLSITMWAGGDQPT